MEASNLIHQLEDASVLRVQRIPARHDLLNWPAHSVCKVGSLRLPSTAHLMGWRRCPPIHTILVSTTERPVQPTLTQVPDVFRPGDQTAHRTQIVHEPQHLLVGKTSGAVVQRDERRQRLCAHDLLLAQEPPANHLVRQLHSEGYGNTSKTTPSLPSPSPNRAGFVPGSK